MNGQALAPDAARPALSLDQVAVVRGGRMLFAPVTCALAAGDAVVVTGANGVGKTSLLRIAAGLLRPVSGRVERGARAAFMGEAAALDGERSVAAALGFWARLDAGRAYHRAVAAALDDVGLADLADVPVRLLSTGQRRRVALARVVASAAPLWLLDEPANGLDAAAVARLEALVARHRRGGGGAMIATHLPLALPGASRIALA